MAIYHCSVHVLKRSAGRSSVQFSAYMSGSKEYDERTQTTYSHTTKEEVGLSDMIFAERVPEKIRDPESFWNSVEQSEKQNNSQVARTWEVALPNELDREHAEALTRSYAMSLVEKDGMPACQFAIHEKDGNLHAHLMAPLRDMDENGKWLSKRKMEYALDKEGNRIPKLDPETGEQKLDSNNRKQWERISTDRNNWNSREQLNNWRDRWEKQVNATLELTGSKERVSCQSYKDQGIDKIPQIHEGYVARQMGDRSDRVKINQEIRELNEEKAKLPDLHKALEQAQEKLNQLREEFSHVRNIASEHIRGIADRIGRRHSYPSDRCDQSRDGRPGTETLSPNPGNGSSERTARALQLATERESRETDRERLRIAREQEAERSRRNARSR